MVLDALEGDGVSEVLFAWLHKRDELNYGPSIWLPDTIVYKFGQPVHWYFTGVDGKLRKKHKPNLVNVRIEEAFTKRCEGCDVIAYYISEDRGEDGRVSSTSVEYLDRGAFRDFLYGRRKENNNGLLQRFVEPKGVSNAVVRAIWSPKVCLLERRVNTKPLHDARYGLYERAITYEGPEHYSEATPLRGSSLPSQVQRICENLVNHVAEVSFQKQRIARMVANFKVDAKDRVWLLWSSSIRLEEAAFSSGGGGGGGGGGATDGADATHEGGLLLPQDDDDVPLAPSAPFAGMMMATTTKKRVLNIDSVVRIPSHVRLTDTPNHAEAPEPHHPSRACISCARTTSSDRFHPIRYKVVIQHFERLMGILRVDAQGGGVQWPPDPLIVEAAGGVGFGSVLPLVTTITTTGKKKAATTTGGEAFLVVPPKTVKEVDVKVPPILRQVHPRLSVPFYLRYRKDPLFLYKTVDVCEDCFLVYAELASSTTTASTTARRAGRFFLPDGSQMPPPQDAAAWQPVPMAEKKKKQQQRGKMKQHGGGRFMPQVAPTMPPPIFSADSLDQTGGGSDDDDTFYAGGVAPEASMLGSAMASPFTTTTFVGAASSSSSSTPGAASLSIDDMVRKREEAFFRECAANDAMHSKTGGHPLAHLVTTFRALQTHAGAASGMEHSLNQQTTDLAATGSSTLSKRSPYLARPVLYEPPHRHAKSQADLASKSVASQSSKQHRAFLMQTLRDVQQNIQPATNSAASLPRNDGPRPV